MATKNNFIKLVNVLKAKEIKYHQMKIIHLSKSISKNPDDASLNYYLNQSLERLEILLTA